LGKSRSQLYTQAISSYIARHQQDAVTQQLNKIYADNSEPMDKILLKLQRQSLPKEEW
jgi:hypothetical protein